MFDVRFDKQIATITGKIKTTIDRAAEKALTKAAEDIARDERLSMENIGFNSVTGNLWKSIGVAALYKGFKDSGTTVREFSPSSGSKPALRPTLAPGERFSGQTKHAWSYKGNSGYSEEGYEAYYSGLPVRGRGYSAPMNSPEEGGKLGTQERASYVARLRYESLPKDNIALIRLFCALPYGEYAGAKKSVMFMTRALDWMPEKVQESFARNFDLIRGK